MGHRRVNYTISPDFKPTKWHFPWKRGPRDRHSAFLLSARTQRGEQVIGHALSVEAVLLILASLFILFLWLQFVLAVEIESTGRQIGVKLGEWEQIERENATLRQEIAAARSQRNLSERAYQLGYGYRPPLFLRLTQPLVRSQEELEEVLPQLLTRGGQGGTTAPHSPRP